LQFTAGRDIHGDYRGIQPFLTVVFMVVRQKYPATGVIAAGYCIKKGLNFYQ
jgi:hypothetical protein